MRALLESLAHKTGFDPLAADNWYSITAQDFACQHQVCLPPLLSSLLCSLFSHMNVLHLSLHSVLFTGSEIHIAVLREQPDQGFGRPIS